MPTIEITITPDGKTTIHVEGVHGPACTSLTHGLEQALSGGNAATVERDLTTEYYATETEQEGRDYA